MNENKKDKLSWREFLQLNEVAGYFFRKKDPNRQTNFSLRSMHFVNKFSMVVFLLAIIYLIVKHFILS